MPESVLVVAAHADDEVLGCGGAIASHTFAGDRVEVVLMTDGVSSRSTHGDQDKDVRYEAALEASKILGVSNLHSFSFPDNGMDGVPLIEITRVVEEIVRSLQPSIVYTHHHNDLNIDHRQTHRAVLTACRPQPRFTVKQILGFEVLSSTEWNTAGANPFTPTVFTDISSLLDIKLEALKAYAQEMRPAPHSRSFEHVEVLAKHRGFSVGLSAAEAFEMYRWVR